MGEALGLFLGRRPCKQLLGVGLVFLTLLVGCGKAPRNRVVLYCAQDREFAEPILADFSRRTGIEVVPHFDTEAAKSVSLVEELVREADRPRCDVFWNNEVLGTIRLQRRGILTPYASPAAASFPAWARARDKTWTAFAARARVLLVNTQRVAEKDQPRGLWDLLQPRWRGQLCLAKPQYGTTATQAACLFAALGPEEARRFYLGLRANGAALVGSNKQAAEAVSHGQFALAWTDTDDALIEVEAGRPVAVVFLDSPLFIPNTVALIRNGPNPKKARQLIDFLLSPEVETRLAQGPSRQAPVNPDLASLEMEPPMKTPGMVKTLEVDFEKAAEMWEEVQDFLRNEFARP